MQNRKPLLFMILVLVFSFYQPVSAEAGLFQIVFIDVGQGEAALLQDPNGFTVLIDGGQPSVGSTLVNFLRSRGVRQIDVMVATHPDSDHIGGLVSVLQMNDVPVKSVLYNGYSGTTATWTNFVNAVYAEGLTLSVATYPQTLTWGLMTVEVINPVAGLSNPDTNESCLAVIVAMGQVRTLFACDLESSSEMEMLARPVNLDADILKVAHHGSRSSTTQAFLDAVTPREAVISVGENSYGHPSAEVLARLEDAGARIWRTDESGHITVLTDGLIYSVNQPLPVVPPGISLSVYLPLIVREEPHPTLPAPTPTPPVPTAVPTPNPTVEKVVITRIFYDGRGRQEPDEYVEIQNQGGSAVQLQGWTLSDAQNHVFTFPNFSIQPNQTCRVYTNESHPEWCGFSYGSGSAIWNNTGDTATLRNAQGVVVSAYSYR